MMTHRNTAELPIHLTGEAWEIGQAVQERALDLLAEELLAFLSRNGVPHGTDGADFIADTARQGLFDFKVICTDVEWQDTPAAPVIIH